MKILKLPCKHCQKELDEEINNIDIDRLTESMYLFKWSYNFHNKINAKLNKTTLLTYEDAIKIHTNKIKIISIGIIWLKIIILLNYYHQDKIFNIISYF